ncbi:MAG: bifunctional UDP-N-acetylglucosamine diphosphorylase/glucosamine-1-phosphate N-acetyltransferase GlmU [Methylobacteriaceae bacterium]|nr:bifunctional UDP-N-acetylglucosamine diphosphorylase/glucosamine-1-phosphate N-acetyltransferase GlmU [Methylobacteriaceae bacterium]
MSPPAVTRSCLAVVLAAGQGQRMRSERPKVLHEIAGRSLLGHAIAALREAGVERIAVVVGPGREDVAAEALRLAPSARIFVQAERRGTAHAVLQARAAIAEGVDDVVVAFADTPLVRPETFRALRAELTRGATVAALGFEAADPTGYGRLIVADGALTAIVEHKDASPAQRAVTLCNAGLMAIEGRHALALLEAIDDRNAQGEFYLTDAVAKAIGRGLGARALIAPEAEVMGVNDRVQLAAAEALIQTRLREAAMRGGATLVDPASVHFSHDTRLGRDVTVEPGVWFGPGVEVADGAIIHAFSHLEGARVGPDATIGPFARLRPGAALDRDAKIGNFVEIKKSSIGAGAKVNHLSYVGDASIGAGANIGAGVVTCNYDGFLKYRTEIGDKAFVGTNSSLVAPVRIGAGAFIGSGSVITHDVAADSLAVGRARQVEKAGWARAFRLKKAQEKSDAKG